MRWAPTGNSPCRSLGKTRARERDSRVIGDDKLQARARATNLPTALSQVAEESLVDICPLRVLFQRNDGEKKVSFYRRHFPNNHPKIIRRWNPAPSHPPAMEWRRTHQAPRILSATQFLALSLAPSPLILFYLMLKYKNIHTMLTCLSTFGPAVHGPAHPSVPSSG